jgi:hypothetical protein
MQLQCKDASLVIGHLHMGTPRVSTMPPNMAAEP